MVLSFPSFPPFHVLPPARPRSVRFLNHSLLLRLFASRTRPLPHRRIIFHAPRFRDVSCFIHVRLAADATSLSIARAAAVYGGAARVSELADDIFVMQREISAPGVGADWYKLPSRGSRSLL